MLPHSDNEDCAFGRVILSPLIEGKLGAKPL